MRSQEHLPACFPLIAVAGPTAAGKTAVAIRLARRLRGEIINMDSIQAYKGLDIGSAKPSLEEQEGAVHHLIDIREPFEPLDAAVFAMLASRTAERIIRAGKAVILAGGTGFYLEAVLSGLSSMPGRMPGIRKSLRDLAGRSGTGLLHEFLKETDPASAARIHPNDLYRVIRAIEVYLSSGRLFSWWCREGRNRRKSLLGRRSCLRVGLLMPREELYQRIDRRVDEMIEAGFVQEVEALLAKGLDPRLKPLQSLGYRHIIRYLQGECSLDQAVWEMKRDTRRYAKRQMTWFKKDPWIRWFRPDHLLSCSDIWKAVN